jgi:hypothetical protein
LASSLEDLGGGGWGNVLGAEVDGSRGQLMDLAGEVHGWAGVVEVSVGFCRHVPGILRAGAVPG